MASRLPAFALIAALPLALAAGAPADSAGSADSTAQPEVMASGAAVQAIREAVDAIIAEGDLPTAQWGIYVRDLTDGSTVYARGADHLFLPASNLKLVTTALALDVFGPGHRFATRLYFDGETSPDGVMRGDLVVRGAGDPTFGSRASGNDPFVAWADALKAAGVRSIEGRLLGDDDVVEENPWAEGWDVSLVAGEQYAQGVGGLSWGDNLIGVTVRGGRVETSPPDFAVIDGPSGSGGLRIARRLGTNVIDVRGAGANASVMIPIEHPTRYALHAFRQALQSRDIAVNVELVDADDLPGEPDYASMGAPLLAHLSPPLSEIVTHINRRSDNFYAEQLFRVSSPDGAATGASARAIALLGRAGTATDGLSIRDGSGLSRKDLVSPRALVDLLAYMDRHEHRTTFIASLPSGGGAGSTLSRRLSDLDVQAKTGSLEYARALTGYVRGPNGRRLAFSVIANNYTTRSGRIVDAVDRVVRAIATGQRVEAEAGR